MQNAIYDEFAEEYNYEDIDHDESFVSGSGGVHGQPVGYHNLGPVGFAEFDDIEDFADDTGNTEPNRHTSELTIYFGCQSAFSSPSPPERTHSLQRNGPRYHPSQNQHHSSRFALYRAPVFNSQPPTRSVDVDQPSRDYQSYSQRNERESPLDRGKSVPQVMHIDALSSHR